MTWGSRNVVVSWPPKNGVVVLNGQLGFAQIYPDRPLTRSNNLDPATPAKYSRADLDAASRVFSGKFPEGVMLLGGGVDEADNRVAVDVAVADKASVRAIAKRFADPAIFRINGTGLILVGK